MENLRLSPTPIDVVAETSGLKPKADEVQELNLGQIQRHNSDLKRLISGIGATMNPFLVCFCDENLHCISTGKVKQRILQKRRNRVENGMKGFGLDVLLIATCSKKPMVKSVACIPNFVSGLVTQSSQCVNVPRKLFTFLKCNFPQLCELIRSMVYCDVPFLATNVKVPSE